MLHSFKRWLNVAPSGSDWRPFAAWAKQRGHDFKRARDGEGFAVEGAIKSEAAPARKGAAGVPWRLEWGPPQRDYIATHELRVRAELELHSGLQILVLSSRLLEQLESETFDRYTETLQTRIDSSTPEEMRWLAMFPRVDVSDIRTVRGHFGAVASVPLLAARWLAGPLGTALAQARTGLITSQSPFLLMTNRHRVQLRLECTDVSVRDLDQAVSLFETAVRQALMLRHERPPSGSTVTSDSGFDHEEPA